MSLRVHPPCPDQGRKLAVTYREAAMSLGVCERTVWGLVRDGKISSIRIGRSVRIPVSELRNFVADTHSEVTP